MRKYILDPYIVSILYQTENDEDTLKHYQEIISKMMQLVQESIRYFFTEKKLPKDQVESILTAIESEKIENLSPETLQMLKSEELGQLISDSLDSLGKILYDSLLPTLDAESRKELHKYLKTIEPIIKENALNILSTMLPIYNENSDLNAIAGQGQTQKPAEQSVVNSPAINLGGVNTMNPPTSQSTPQAMPQAENNENLNPMKIPPTVDIPQGSAVDMALQSVINSPQPEVLNQEVPVVAIVEETPVETPTEVPVTETPAEMPAQEVAPTVTPEAMMGNEIQFTPLTEVPQVPEVVPQVAPEAQVSQEAQIPQVPQEVVPAPPVPVIEAPISILDNQLPALPTNMSEQPVEMAQPQANVNQPLSAINKLDGLGISLDESANKPQ